MRRLWTLVLGWWMISSMAFAQSAPLLSAGIRFNSAGKAEVTFKTQGPNDETLNYKIQSILMFYAYAMHQLGEAQGLTLLNQVQKSIPQLATPSGLMRSNIIRGNPLTQIKGKPELVRGYDLIFQREKTGYSLEVKPVDASPELLSAAYFYYMQKMVNDLPENGFRLMVLALGGMNKYYREVGRASDPSSLSQAPAYGLNLAIDILSKVSGQKM